LGKGLDTAQESLRAGSEKGITERAGKGDELRGGFKSKKRVILDSKSIVGRSKTFSRWRVKAKEKKKILSRVASLAAPGI